MNEEKLKELGLEDDQIKSVLKEHKSEIDGNYVTKSRFNEVNSEKKRLETDIKDRDKQLETLKDSTEDVEGLKKQIDTLQTENKEKDKQHASEIKQMKVDNAITSALTASKAKNEKAVRALLDVDPDKVEFNDDGSIKGLDEQLKTLTEAEDSKFLFNTETKKQTLKGATPGETGTEDPDTKVDVSKMTYEELAAYMENNPDAEI